MLPEDSSNVKVDTTGLSDADLERAKRTQASSSLRPPTAAR